MPALREVLLQLLVINSKHFMKQELHAKLLHCLLNRKTKAQGFTILELMVVLIIVGMLTAMALPSFLSQSNKARRSEAQTYMGSINRGQQAYYIENQIFATALENLELGLSESQSYNYSVASADQLASVAKAEPRGAALNGFAGKVWIATGNDLNSTVYARVCEGPLGVAPDDCPP
jgi:prepilin-type N-terminal cleavage/methylation domain-containing protein